MPRLWNDTIAAHRAAVREAILDTTATHVAEHGLASITMSQIAEDAGIGRATLYKYFPDVEAILLAWHERQVARHVAQLRAVRDRADDPAARLRAVLETYALIAHEHDSTELAALLHRGDHVARARQHLSDFLKELLSEGARTGHLRDDVPADELAAYCLHSLSAAGGLRSRAAVHRLVTVTLAGLHRPA